MKLFRKANFRESPSQAQELGVAVRQIQARRPATEKQREYIAGLANQTGSEIGFSTSHKMTISEASHLLEDLLLKVPPTQKQLDYATSLAGEQGIDEQIPANATSGSVSHMIDELVDRTPATERQAGYLQRLCEELGIVPSPGEITQLGKSTASRYIDALVTERDEQSNEYDEDEDDDEE